MSKRRADSSIQSQSKKVKREPREPSPPTASVAGSAYSVRQVAVLTLTTLAIKSFSRGLLKLVTEENYADTAASLKALPEHLLLRVLSQLAEAWPGRMTHEFIVEVFFRSGTHSVKLPGSLQRVKKETIRELSRLRGTLVHLEVTGHKIPDATFAMALSSLPKLEHINLQACALVGAQSCKAIAQKHESLKYLNLGGTATTLSDVKSILQQARDLEVLKLVSLEGLTDLTLSRLIEEFFADELFEPLPSSPLAKLHSLKLRHNSVTGQVLAQLLLHLPKLEKLDLSFVPIGSILFTAEFTPPPLTKLSLTSTPFDARQLIPVLEKLPNLKILNIGALGASAKTASGFSMGGGSTGAMGSKTLNDAVLLELTEALRPIVALESVSLAGNSSLGMGADRGMPYFIAQVGRRLKSLNLGGLTHLRSQDLESLIPAEGSEGTPCLLERLILMGCRIDDEAAIYISACSRLNFLDVENTKLTEDALLDIVNACPLLDTLNLTSCRRVNVTDRRRFFDVWRAAKHKDESEGASDAETDSD